MGDEKHYDDNSAKVLLLTNELQEKTEKLNIWKRVF